MDAAITTKTAGRASRILPSLQRLWMHADAGAPDFQFIGLNGGSVTTSKPTSKNVKGNNTGK